MDHNPAGPKSLYICLTAAFSLMLSLTVTLQPPPPNLFLRLLLLFCWFRFVCSWCRFFLKLLYPVLTDFVFFPPLTYWVLSKSCKYKAQFYVCAALFYVVSESFLCCCCSEAANQKLLSLRILTNFLFSGHQFLLQNRITQRKDGAPSFCDQSQKVKIRAEEAH